MPPGNHRLDSLSDFSFDCPAAASDGESFTPLSRAADAPGHGPKRKEIFMRKALLILGVLAAWHLTPGRAPAWHDNGHMTIARIAYLGLDDGQKAQVARILKAHPHYAIFLSQDRPQDVPEIEWAFMRAATWADWVRPPWREGAPRTPEVMERVRKYHRGVWHYINLPFVPPGSKVEAPKNLPAPDWDRYGEPGNVLAALKKSMTILRAADMPDDAKAIYLCWLLHLAGDLHQPLHAAALVSEDYPEGDMGGNLFLVAPKEGAPAVNLHFYWDALLFNPESGYKDVEALSNSLMRDPKLQRDRLPELKANEFKDWAAESAQLARDVVYRGGKLAGVPRPKDKAELAKIQAPVLPEGYAQTANAVARRRMALAGYRIADKLREVLGKE
jgi:hypothetical protein